MLHPQSKLTMLQCQGIACVVVDFWDLISAPALMELDIKCHGLKFTDHCPTVPPAAVAALQRGILSACFRVIIDNHSSLQPEAAIMESCGMVVHEFNIGFGIRVNSIFLELPRRMSRAGNVMRDVRHSADLPFSPAQLSRRLTGDSCIEHTLQQQAWHAEFLYHKICFPYFDLKGPSLLSVL